MLINGRLPKLGKKPVRHDSRTLKLKDYLPKALPAPPIEVSWITRLKAAMSIPLYFNDILGDCVEAAAGHMIQQWNFYAGHPYQPTDGDVLNSYEVVGGYVPGNPVTDQGTDMLSFLNYWRTTGVAGHKITAFLAVDWTNDVEVRQAIYLFGNAMFGISLPVTAQGELGWTVSAGGIYTPNGASGSWGGHCIPLVASSPLTTTCETWGTTLKMSHNFRGDYGEECWCVLDQDWISATGLSPSQFNFAQLQADLAEITA